jgi:uridine kinase
LVAIVGGSGSGKTWLADKLKSALAPHAVSLSLDDFYLDRSYLPPTRRAQLNFDHPRAIDWTGLEYVLLRLLARRSAHLPCYDFGTHRRFSRTRAVAPRTFIILDGLWLLRRRTVRRLVSFSVFLECPRRTRLRRRLARDLRSRSRTRRSIQRQFRTTVEPMHTRFVEPQGRLAHLVLRRGCTKRDVWKIASYLRGLTVERTQASPPSVRVNLKRALEEPQNTRITRRIL